MHQVDHFNCECLTSVNVERLINFPSCSISKLHSHLPFNIFAKYFFNWRDSSLWRCLCEKIILLLLLLD